MYTYVIGYIGNEILNMILKRLFQQPRPDEERKDIFNMEIKYGEKIDSNRYGMPSRHAQSVFYSTVFVQLVLKKPWITVVYFCISLLTLYERKESNKHYITQLMAGSMIGIIVGYAIYHYGSRSIPKKAYIKPDDNAF